MSWFLFTLLFPVILVTPLFFCLRFLLPMSVCSRMPYGKSHELSKTIIWALLGQGLRVHRAETSNTLTLSRRWCLSYLHDLIIISSRAVEAGKIRLPRISLEDSTEVRLYNLCQSFIPIHQLFLSSISLENVNAWLLRDCKSCSNSLKRFFICN